MADPEERIYLIICKIIGLGLARVYRKLKSILSKRADKPQEGKSTPSVQNETVMEKREKETTAANFNNGFFCSVKTTETKIRSSSRNIK